MTANAKHTPTRWNKRERTSGRYARGPKCDACGKPTGDDYITDNEVCMGSDRPGFYLCDRPTCAKRYEHLPAPERQAFYESRHAARRAALAQGEEATR